MRHLTIPEMAEAIIEICVGMNKRCGFWGRFGVGKSAAAKLAVKKLNEPGKLKEILGDDCPYVRCELIDTRLGQYDSVDMRGFPHPDKASGTAIWYPPGTMPFYGNEYDEKTGRGFREDTLYLWFLDEITSASTSVFAVCYQLFLDNCIGEHVVMENVRMCCAGNLADDKGVVNKIPMPLYNRMDQFLVVNPKDEFCFHAQAAGVPPVFIAFWNFKEPLINTYDPKSTTQVVATQRSWMEMAVPIYQNGRLSHKLKEAAMVGAIGEGPTAEFLAFADIWKSLTPIKDIIANPESVALPAEPSLRFAMAMHISGNMSPKNISALHKYLTRMPPEFVVMAWQLAVEREKNLFNTPAFLEYMKKYRDVYTN